MANTPDYELHIEYVPISKLKPYERNARKHTKKDLETIENSIQKFGFLDPVGVWSDDLLIVEGHGRVMAAKKLKMTEVPIIRLDHLTDEQRRAYALAHNKTAELSTWDELTLSLELEDLKLTDIDMTDLGFILPEGEKDIEDVQEDDFDEELPEEPKSKPGDVYQLGQHRLMCGDSTDANVVARLMAGQKADILVTDPPYNVDYTGGTKDALKIMNDKMEDTAFREFLKAAFQSADSVMRNGAVFYIWHSDSEGYNFRGACHDIGWKVRECLIWNKNSLVIGRQDYQWKHEPCLYGWKEGASHLWASDRKQTTVLDFDRPKKSDLHPTMKPVKMIAYQISNNTHEGDAVLDLFGGSGTTLVAAEQLNRKCYICELDPRYVDVIVDRWEKMTGEKAVLVEQG